MIEYEVKVEIPENSEVWPRLSEEIPSSAKLLAALVVLTHRQAHVLLTYQGFALDGTKHKRTSTQRVSLASHLGADPSAFIKEALGKSFSERVKDLVRVR